MGLTDNSVAAATSPIFRRAGSSTDAISVRTRQATTQPRMTIRAVVVQADDGHALALGRVLAGDGVERGDGRGIPDVRLAHVDDDVPRIAHVVELVDEIVTAGEEQLPTHRVHAGAVVGVCDLEDLRE